MDAQLPFLGMSLIQAPRKLLVSSPFVQQQLAYLRRGRLRMAQHFFITMLLKPSSPAADFRLHLLIDLSNSSRESGLSRMTDSALDILEFVTNGEEQISSPRKSSTNLSFCRSSLGGAL